MYILVIYPTIFERCQPQSNRCQGHQVPSVLEKPPVSGLLQPEQHPHLPGRDATSKDINLDTPTSLSTSDTIESRMATYIALESWRKLIHSEGLAWLLQELYSWFCTSSGSWIGEPYPGFFLQFTNHQSFTLPWKNLPSGVSWCIWLHAHHSWHQRLWDVSCTICWSQFQPAVITTKQQWPSVLIAALFGICT